MAKMTNAEWSAAMREQLWVLEAAYQRSQRGRKWLRKNQPVQAEAPTAALPELSPVPLCTPSGTYFQPSLWD